MNNGFDTEGLIEFEGETPADIKNLVPARELLTEHKKRWAVPTSKGFVVLKKITKFDRDEISLRLLEDAEYAALTREYQPYWNVLKANAELPPDRQVELPAEDLARLIEIGKKMAGKTRLFMLACIVEPTWIKSVEDLDVFLTGLSDEESDRLYNLLTKLSAPNNKVRVAGGVLEIAQKYGIKLTQDDSLTMDNMTANQADAFMGSLVDESKMTASTIENIRRDVRS